jgi:hypothetical protein
MIDKVNISQLQDILAGTAARHNRSAEPGQTPSADASLQADYAALIKQASNLDSDDAARVDKARQLLRTGQLDSSQNIIEAAQNIADFGV